MLGKIRVRHNFLKNIFSYMVITAGIVADLSVDQQNVVQIVPAGNQLPESQQQQVKFFPECPFDSAKSVLIVHQSVGVVLNIAAQPFGVGLAMDAPPHLVIDDGSQIHPYGFSVFLYLKAEVVVLFSVEKQVGK